MSETKEPVDLVAGLIADGWPPERAAKLAARAEAAAIEHGTEPEKELDVIVRELWALSGADPRNP
jgi:hypothetical protein